jgi:hypothetical protein
MANAMVEEEMEIPMKVRVTLLDCQLCGKACMHYFRGFFGIFRRPAPSTQLLSACVVTNGMRLTVLLVLIHSGWMKLLAYRTSCKAVLLATIVAERQVVEEHHLCKSHRCRHFSWASSNHPCCAVCRFTSHTSLTECALDVPCCSWFLVKVLIVGNGAVGKSSMMRR